jgi:pimeloyl-ACP methyl ester carboxylesterase
MTVDKLIELAVPRGGPLDSQSGIQNNQPRIYGRFAAPDTSKPDVACIIMHPTSNFMGHYLISPLARQGLAVLALNSRYAGNDTALLTERVLQDLGAGVAWLRQVGFGRVVLIGNSGGAALMSCYQAEAERPTAFLEADGRPSGLRPDDLSPADGIVLSAAHPGRARLLLDWIDPSVTDENDPVATDLALDLYGGTVQPTYAPEFITRFRAAQRDRRDRIEAFVVARLAELEAAGFEDAVVLVHRTHADPRFLDLSLDRNDRASGSIWGDAAAVNRAPYAMGRVSTLRSWLSQWSSRALADGPACLWRTRIPALLLTHTADGSTFPSTQEMWEAAGSGRLRSVQVKGGTHYLKDQADLVEFSARAIARWIMDEVRR